MKHRHKGLLVLVLSLVMVLSMVTVGWGSMTPQGVHACDTADCLVCDVAAKINALPAAADITVNNAAAVTEQIHAIDRVKVELTDAQYDELLTVVTTRPSSSGYGLAEPVRYMEAVEKVTSLNAGGSLYISKSYSVGSAALDWAQTDATISIECLDAGSTFAPLSVTLADIAEPSLAGFYSADADGWTNRYILPAGTYKITETAYNAVTTSGTSLTTTASYSVDGNAVSTDYAVVEITNGGSCVVMVTNSTPVQIGGIMLIPNEYYVKNSSTNEEDPPIVAVDGVPSDNYAIVEDSTLTLKNFVFEGSSGITADDDLTIVLEGENTITSTSGYGISVTGNLTITGSGKLTATGNTSGIAATSVTITDGTITAGSVTNEGTDDVSYSPFGIYATSAITINGGTVEATGNDAIAIYEYNSNGTVTISGGTVTANGGNSGIYAKGSVTITDGTVTATASGEAGTGIKSKGITIEGGTVNATGQKYGIDTYTLKISGDNTKVTATGGETGIYTQLKNNQYPDPNTITISGGTVTATGQKYGIDTFTLAVSGDNTKVTATGGETGIYTQLKDNLPPSAIEISGGTVNAAGNNYGINTHSLTISGDNTKVTASGAYSCGIYARESNDSYGDITITGGTVTATGGIYGIAADVVTIKGGIVTIDANTTAIGCTALDMNDSGGVWYQWTNDKNATVMNTTALQIADAKEPYLQIAPPYAVFFNANGGTGTMDRAVGVSGNYPLPENSFTAPAGKEFKGWATSADGEVISTTNYSVTGNTTLYAIWKDKTTGGGNQGGGYPGIPGGTTTPAEDKVKSAETFDGGVALSVAVTILSATGSAYLAKKKD